MASYVVTYDTHEVKQDIIEADSFDEAKALWNETSDFDYDLLFIEDENGNCVDY